MRDLDGMTQSEALSNVERLRRDQDKLIDLTHSSPAKALLSAVKVIREHSERIRSIEERHLPAAVYCDSQRAEDPEATAFEAAVEGEVDVLNEAISRLDAAKEKTDDPVLFPRLATEREKMADCLQNAIRVRNRIRTVIVSPSEQE